VRAILVPILTIWLASAALAGCHAARESPKPLRPAAEGETLRIGTGVRPDNLEISQVTNAAVANLLENVVETLVTIDENGKIAPLLAERWDISEDGRQFTFDLRQGVTFQDGAPLDAAAVAWNIDRVQQINLVAECPAVAFELAAIESVQPVDRDTVRFNLSQPLPNFLATLSWISWGILSPGSESQTGNTRLNIQRPVGTGPYAFAGLSAEELRLSRFDGYRGGQPYFDNLAFRFVDSPGERERGLAGDQLDVILVPSARQLSSLARSSEFAVVTRPGTRSIFVTLNNLRPPFDDVRVRRAVNLAVDKKALIDEVLMGAATVSEAPVAPGVLGYCPIGAYGYDPKAAKALLAEAKVRPGTPLRMLTPRGRYLEDEAVSRRIAEYLGAVGFKVTVEALDWPAFMGELFRPPEKITADLHLFGWAPTFPDADWQLPHLYDSANWPPLGAAGSFYKNPEVDKLLAAGKRELDPRTRADLFCQASRQIWADAPAIFLWVQSFPVAYRAGLTNIVALPNEKISAAFARPASAPPARKPERRKPR
jgi:peptide/nickel transport system substrate-binding protein